MDDQRMPKPGEIYDHFKDKPYQIITIATNTETDEPMVVYQALYGDFKTYVRPLTEFVGEVDRGKYPNAKQKYKYELRNTQTTGKATPKQDASMKSESSSDHQMPTVGELQKAPVIETEKAPVDELPKTPRDEMQKTPVEEASPVAKSEMSVNEILMRFLDAESYNRKLEILTSNVKHLDDRLINDMAVALDCAVDEGPIDQRIQGLVSCLQAMSRFEDRRLR